MESQQDWYSLLNKSFTHIHSSTADKNVVQKRTKKRSLLVHPTQIKKAQKHQAKGYNNRHASGSTFEVGMKILHKNSRQSLSKLRSKYLGLYTILSHCENGNFILKYIILTVLKPVFTPQSWWGFMKTKCKS